MTSRRLLLLAFVLFGCGREADLTLSIVVPPGVERMLVGLEVEFRGPEHFTIFVPEPDSGEPFRATVERLALGDYEIEMRPVAYSAYLYGEECRTDPFVPLGSPVASLLHEEEETLETRVFVDDLACLPRTRVDLLLLWTPDGPSVSCAYLFPGVETLRVRLRADFDDPYEDEQTGPCTDALTFPLEGVPWVPLVLDVEALRADGSVCARGTVAVPAQEPQVRIALERDPACPGP